MVKLVLICALAAVAFTAVKSQYAPAPLPPPPPPPPSRTAECIRLGYDAAVITPECRDSDGTDCALFCVRSGYGTDCVPESQFCCCRRRRKIYGSY